MLDIVKGALNLIDAPESSELLGKLLDSGPLDFGGLLESAGGAQFSGAAGSLGVLGSVGVLGGSTLNESAVRGTYVVIGEVDRRRCTSESIRTDCS